MFSLRKKCQIMHLISTIEGVAIVPTDVVVFCAVVVAKTCCLILENKSFGTP